MVIPINKFDGITTSLIDSSLIKTNNISLTIKSLFNEKSKDGRSWIYRNYHGLIDSNIAKYFNIQLKIESIKEK